jgi:hypothetical protein
MALLLGKRDGRIDTGRLFYFSLEFTIRKTIRDETPMVHRRPMRPAGSGDSTLRQLAVKL